MLVFHNIELFKELITIDIEVKKHNRIKNFFYKLYSKVEDLLFAIICKLPEKFIPSLLMNWIDKYLDKRIKKLKQQSIKMTWKNMYLQNTVTKIHKMQQDIKEACSDD